MKSDNPGIFKRFNYSDMCQHKTVKTEHKRIVIMNNVAQKIIKPKLGVLYPINIKMHSLAFEVYWVYH